MENKLQKYTDFVDSLLSEQSRDTNALIANLERIESQGVNATKLMTAAAGIAGEGGEFADRVKKLLFHGEASLETAERERMKKELGDLAFYLAVACIALDVSIDEVIDGNVGKLTERFPDGEFNLEHSLTRAKD